MPISKVCMFAYITGGALQRCLANDGHPLTTVASQQRIILSHHALCVVSVGSGIERCEFRRLRQALHLIVAFPHALIELKRRCCKKTIGPSLEWAAAKYTTCVSNRRIDELYLEKLRRGTNQRLWTTKQS
jgi:hypothetical protein